MLSWEVISCFKERGHLSHPWEAESSLETKSNLLPPNWWGGWLSGTGSCKVSGWVDSASLSFRKVNIKGPLVCQTSCHTPGGGLKERSGTGAHLTLADFQVILQTCPGSAHSNTKNWGPDRPLLQDSAHPGQLLLSGRNSTPGPRERHGCLIPSSLNEAKCSFTSGFWVQITDSGYRLTHCYSVTSTSPHNCGKTAPSIHSHGCYMRWGLGRCRIYPHSGGQHVIQKYHHLHLQLRKQEDDNAIITYVITYLSNYLLHINLKWNFWVHGKMLNKSYSEAGWFLGSTSWPTAENLHRVARGYRSSCCPGSGLESSETWSHQGPRVNGTWKADSFGGDWRG